MKRSEYIFPLSETYRTYVVSEAIIHKITNYQHNPGIIGLGKYEPQAAFFDSNYLLVDSVNDPGNLGTLLRSA